MDDFHDPFFRGCTRPAMLFGVPLVCMVLLTGAFLLAGLWSLYLLSPYVTLFQVLLYLPLVLWMRMVTKHDDQGLRQLLLRARMRGGRQANRLRWGAYSYSPCRCARLA